MGTPPHGGVPLCDEERLRLHDPPARALAREFETLANRGRRYRPDEWLSVLCQDVLAGFGRRLDQPWDEERRERLFPLART
ncbi:hypothetical protein [Thiocystis violacea]|uniref:hypothetical protein n=1 Tax=Thiocystis violacea TaxID=13725 RepID=UPI001904BF0C|nr:hypothetical protein [Thiocystis violacea]MBK1717196.1 hypothetical protein [Thiocystis violacea]